MTQAQSAAAVSPPVPQDDRCRIVLTGGPEGIVLGLALLDNRVAQLH